MTGWKRGIKALLSMTPYRIRRAQALNRFESIAEGLALISRLGFSPTRIVDGGANVGTFATMAHVHFPRARIDMIEPQPECASRLESLCERHGFAFHPVALVGPDRSGESIGFVVTPGSITTGAHIGEGTDDPSATTVLVKGVSLDELLAPSLAEGERLLLKLDLEGHEFDAITGGHRLLQSTEVVLTESAFFGDSSSTNSPLQLASLLADQGFALFDVLSISGRPGDNRARQCDLLFVKETSPISLDRRWR